MANPTPATLPSAEEFLNAPGVSLPKRIYWLNGAPGAGKGTHTPSLLRCLGIKTEPVVTSDLLKTPEARKLIDAGQLVGDKEVISLLMAEISKDIYRDGVIVDGFPRTAPQVEFIRKLHAAWAARAAATGKAKSDFHVIVLLVDEKESVRRQMQRGQETAAKEGAQAVRKTDLDPELARSRYQVFMDQTIKPLETLRGAFPCHIIDTNGTIEEIGKRIVGELTA